MYLEYNKVSDDGAKSFGDALKNNCILTTLDLSDNEIGDEGKDILLKSQKHRLFVRRQTQQNIIMILCQYCLREKDDCLLCQLPLEIIHMIISRVGVPQLYIEH